MSLRHNFGTVLLTEFFLYVRLKLCDGFKISVLSLKYAFSIKLIFFLTSLQLFNKNS